MIYVNSAGQYLVFIQEPGNFQYVDGDIYVAAHNTRIEAQATIGYVTDGNWTNDAKIVEAPARWLRNHEVEPLKIKEY